MRRQIRAPLCRIPQIKKRSTKKPKGSEPERAAFIWQKGHNTTIIEKRGILY